ncbi:MAG: LysR family transcriptional regulator [Rhodobacteraceae bacterium]|nr:LysR family transcriptional regulator [Paracoccaceae bacterium]
MDRFAEIRAFVDVVDAGSFSAAARATGQSRSAVNRLVISLEERLGVQLLHRTTRSVSANSNGHALYQRSKRLLEDLEEIEHAVSSTRREPFGLLRISAPHSFGELDFSKIVAAFLKRYPMVTIDLSFENRLVDPIAEGYDIVIRVSEPDEQTMLVDHRVLSLDYVLCASPEYLEQHGAPTTVEDLRSHRLLSLHQATQSGYWTFLGPDGPIRVPLRPVLSANGLDALLTAATSGLGISVLPEYAIRSELKSGSLRALLGEYRFPSRMLQVVYPPARHLSAKVQMFTDFVDAWCNE